MFFLTQDMKLVSPMNSFAPSKEHQLEATQAEMGDPSCEEIMKFTSRLTCEMINQSH